ncbi:MAG TPA: dUTP diphosphatase [Planctomycetota bacterium]|nr:dUTP diphosphatase [Planctomycetota bacterium]
MDQSSPAGPEVIRVGVRRDPSAADLPYPRYMTAGAAGVDLHAATTEPVIVKMGDVVRIPTGLSFEIPPGYEGQVRARSGLAFEKGLALVNAPGTIDSDYRGEIQVIVTCLSSTPLVIRRGLRFAQIVFCPVARAVFEVKDELGATERGAAGFGHTGVAAEGNVRA